MAVFRASASCVVRMAGWFGRRRPSPSPELRGATQPLIDLRPRHHRGDMLFHRPGAHPHFWMGYRAITAASDGRRKPFPDGLRSRTQGIDDPILAGDLVEERVAAEANPCGGVASHPLIIARRDSAARPQVAMGIKARASTLRSCATKGHRSLLRAARAAWRHAGLAACPPMSAANCVVLASALAIGGCGMRRARYFARGRLDTWSATSPYRRR